MINGNPYIARKFLDINFEYVLVAVDTVAGVSQSRILHEQGDRTYPTLTIICAITVEQTNSVCVGMQGEGARITAFVGLLLLETWSNRRLVPREWIGSFALW